MKRDSVPESILRGAMEAAPIDIALFDSRGALVWANPCYRKTSGIPLTEMIGKHCCAFRGMATPEPDCPVLETLATGVDAQREFDRCLPNHPADTGNQWLSKTAPIRGDNGRIAGVILIARNITARRRAQADVALMSRMLDVAPAAITIHDTQGRFHFANQATFAMHGYADASEFLRVNLHDLDVPESKALLAERLRRIEEDGEARFEVSHYRKDGTIFPLEVHARRIDWKGRPAVLSVATDITQRKRAEDTLRVSENRYRTLVENFPNGAMFLFDRDLRYTFCGGMALKQADIDPAELVGRTLRDCFPPEVSDIAEPVCRGALAGRPGEYTVSYQGRTYKNWALPMTRQDDGVEGAAVFALDVTDQLRAEAALRDSEERFRMLLNDVSMVSVQGYAADGTTLYWNEGSRNLYGYSSEEAVGQNLLNLIIPPEIRDETAKAIRRMIETGIPEPASELTLMRKDGSRVPVYSSHFILRRPGLPLEFYCVDVDLGDIKRAEQERETLREQLAQAQKMESVGRLAGGVAHDFNNMLNVILGHAELALEDLPPNHPLRKNLTEIQSAARRSADLTRQLLAFARKQIIAPKTIDLNNAIASMLKMLGRLIGEDIALTWKPSEIPATVRVDPAQIDQLLANLVVNARDAIGDKGGKIVIETEIKRLGETDFTARQDCAPGEYVMLSVADDGCGMDETTRAQIFEPFFTTKEVGQGTGLGLATVYGIVKQNRGFIEVVSSSDRGTAFNIHLPRHSAETERVSASSAAMPIASGHETILLVEDEPATLEMTRMMLNRLGYRVLAAASPETAILKARKHEGRIHLLMTDVVMPGMNGRDLADRLSPICPEIRKIFMSGYPADVIARQNVLHDNLEFLQKPFSFKTLAKKVRQSLDADPSDENHRAE